MNVHLLRVLVLDKFRLLRHQLLNERREETCQLHVSLLLRGHILHECLVVLLDLEQLLTSLFLLLFVVVNPLLEEVSQVVLLLWLWLCGGDLFLFQNGDLVFVFLNYFLTEMRPLRQLVLDLAVLFHFHTQQLQLLGHSAVLQPDFLNVFGLEVQLRGQLLILPLDHLGRSGQILLVHRDHGRLDVLNSK